MKTLIAVLAAAFLGTTAAFARQAHEHAAGSGLFGLPPEYIHVLLNPIPGYGLGMGVLALVAGLIARNRMAQTIGLGLVILTAASAWPVAHYGLNAFKQIRGLADDAGAEALDEHMERAEKVIYVFYATALLGVVALVSRKKFPRAATPLAVTTLLLGVASLGAGGWIAKAGGQIRHSEFRAMSAASTNAASHEHGAAGMEKKQGGMDHDSMQGKPMSGGEKAQPKPGAMDHGAMQGKQDGGKQITSEPAAEKIPMPETLEGIWKAIQAYQGELESAVNAKKFGEVQSGAKTIGALAKKLADVAPPDRKPVVEAGVKSVSQALGELGSSAETGSDSVMKTRYKELEQALAQLEPLMKKQ